MLAVAMFHHQNLMAIGTEISHGKTVPDGNVMDTFEDAALSVLSKAAPGSYKDPPFILGTLDILAFAGATVQYGASFEQCGGPPIIDMIYQPVLACLLSINHGRLPSREGSYTVIHTTEIE